MTHKIIVTTADNVARYCFPATTNIVVGESDTRAGELVIADLHSGNAEVRLTSTPPEDFAGCKYLMIDGDFEVNPNYTPPEEPA